MGWIFRILALVVLLLAFAVGALVFLPKDRIASIAADQVKAQTGRELTLSGDLSLSFWPVLGVSTGPVTLSNALWAGPQPMISAQSLSIGVDAAALFRGAIRVTHIDMDSPVVRLATRADGRGNWEFGAAAAPAADPATGATGQAITLAHLSIRDANLIYTAAGARPVSLSGVDTTIDWPDPAGPADFAARIGLGSAPLDLTGSIDRFATFLAGAVAPIRLSGDIQRGQFSFDGRASLAGDAAGRLSLAASDTAAVLTGLGLTDASLPQGLGRATQMSADVTFADNRISLRDLSMTLDQNRLTGAVDITLSDVPYVTARLTAGALDFRSLSQGEGGTSGSGSQDDGWSTEPVDGSALAALNGEVSLEAGSIDLGQLQLGATQAVMTLDRSRAVLGLTRAEIFDGTIRGQLVANNRNGLSVGGNLQADQIEMARLLSDLAGITRLSGKSNAQVEFLGVGNSVHAIINSLSGQGSMSMGRGVIAGIDLDRLMRSGDASGGTTVFDSLTASFSMQEGNLTNQDLLLLLSNFRAEGAGRIGLGARDIDYLFMPIALRANSGQGLAIPVRIRGPWSAPRILPDLGEALQLDMDGKVEEVKQDARQRAEQKLQEELGVTRQDGQSTEDAIIDALEDKAKDRLRKLLGGN